MKKYMIPNITIHRFITEIVTTGSANAVDSYMDNIPLIQRANLDWNGEKMQKVKQVIEFSS